MPQTDYWPFSKNKQNEHAERVEFNSSNQSIVLQKQLGDMEGEVKKMQMELAAMRHIRQDVKKPNPSTIEESLDEVNSTRSYDAYRFNDERYNTEDSEVSKLREDLIQAKHAAEDERFHRLKYETKLKDLEIKLNDICSYGKANADYKELRKITDDEVVGLKTQVRDLKEQNEELRMTDDEKSEQLQEYRMKYLQAQQQVEELKRQLDIMDYENKQTSDQIQIELQKMKMQFQEKLLELAPLPDLLKGAQIQLQEAKEFQKLSDDNAQQISNELHLVKEKLVVAVNNLSQEKQDKNKIMRENSACKLELEAKQKEFDEVLKELDEFKCKTMRLEEKLNQQESRYSEKLMEYTQLAKDFEEIRDDSARTLQRLKDRAESTRHFLQAQITGLERQLISCRAQCRSYQKERDEIRQRMQIQIHSLKENFELVEIRLRGMLKQLTLLKHCYSVTVPEGEENVETDSYVNDYGTSQ